jgi:hypothetical protein
MVLLTSIFLEVREKKKYLFTCSLKLQKKRESYWVVGFGDNLRGEKGERAKT